MKIPKYVQNILARSEYEYTFCTRNENYAPGYTIRIRKEVPYMTARVFEREVRRFAAWAQREFKRTYCPGWKRTDDWKGEEGWDPYRIAWVLSVPQKTRHDWQYAVITIVDPIMKDIEEFIGKGK